MKDVSVAVLMLGVVVMLTGALVVGAFNAGHMIGWMEAQRELRKEAR